MSEHIREVTLSYYAWLLDLLSPLALKMLLVGDSICLMVYPLLRLLEERYVYHLLILLISISLAVYEFKGASLKHPFFIFECP